MKGMIEFTVHISARTCLVFNHQTFYANRCSQTQTVSNINSYYICVDYTSSPADDIAYSYGLVVGVGSVFPLLIYSYTYKTS